MTKYQHKKSRGWEIIEACQIIFCCVKLWCCVCKLFMVQQILSSQCTYTASHTETEDLKLNCNLSLYLFCIWSTCRPSFHQHGSHSCTQTSSGSLVACRCCSGRRAGIAQPLTKRCCAPASKFWGGWAGRGWKLLAQNGQTYSTKGLWTSLFFFAERWRILFWGFLMSSDCIS